MRNKRLGTGNTFRNKGFLCLTFILSHLKNHFDFTKKKLFPFYNFTILSHIHCALLVLSLNVVAERLVEIIG